MHAVVYESPEIKPVFLHSEIVDWEFQQKIFKDHNKYCFRFKLTFDDGRKESRQKGGFDTKKQAVTERQKIQTQLYNHEYAAFPYITVKDFYDYYLYHYMAKVKKCTYGTFMSYRNIIYNYIVPAIGNRRLITIKRSDLLSVLSSIESKSVLKLAETVIRGSFRHGKAKNLISYDPSAGAVRDNHIRMQCMQKLYPETTDKIKIPQKSTYSLQQVCKLLALCKAQDNPVFLPLLVTLTTGVRISELIGLKFTDIDYEGSILYNCRQLGRKLEFVENDDTNVRNQECSTKTQNGDRQICVPQLTIDEIILEKKRRSGTDKDSSDYIFCTDQGEPLHRNYYQKMYRDAISQAELPYIRWHDLRHTYATILYNNNLSLKAISNSLGHSNVRITKDVYIEDYTDEDPLPPIVSTLDYMAPFIDHCISNIEQPKYDYNFNMPWESIF